MAEYSTFVKSLMRLYPERVTIEKLNELKENGKITSEEYEAITNK